MRQLLFLIFLPVLWPVVGQGQVTAAFSASVTSGCPPLVVMFTDQSTTSTGTIVSWSWNFANGNTSVLQNPSAGFVNSGTYVVTLTATNSNGQTGTTTKTITVYSKPTVSTSATPSSGCAPLAVQFSSNGSLAGSGTVQSYQWDYGDGTGFGTTANPAHTYAMGGTYTPSLKITNSYGCHTTGIGSSIAVSPGPTAAFSSNNAQGCIPPHTVNFINNSTGTGTLSYDWNLAVNTSTATNPSQTYTAAGSYDIRLITTDGLGCNDTLLQPGFVLISDIEADFSVVSPVCADDQIAITNNSSGATSYAWAWGDGTTGVGANPYKAYTTGGTYTITLTAINGICSETFTATIDVQEITASFTSSPNYGCEVPHTTYYTNTSTINFGTIDLHYWLFGIYDYIPPNLYTSQMSMVDSITRDEDDLGYFSDTLLLVSDLGCVAQAVIPNNVFIEVMIPSYTVDSADGCAPKQVQFTDISVPTTAYAITSWQWKFDNGQTSSQQNPTTTYNDTGCYQPKLIITNGFGCKDSTQMQVCYGLMPTAEASFTVGSICPDDSTWFYNVENDTFANQFDWHFYPTPVAQGKEVLVFFLDTGWHDLEYVVGHHGCRDTARYDSVMYVNGPIVGFGPIINCDSLTYRRFQTLAFKGVQRFYWDFGDGSPLDSVTQNPLHEFPGNGVYNVYLRVYNDSAGCADTLFTQVTIVNLVADFNVTNNVHTIDSVSCIPTAFTFDATPSENELTPYQWSIDGAPDSSILFVSYNKFFYTQGYHPIKLTVTDINGCQKSITKNIFLSMPVAGFDFDYTGNCDPVEILFTDSSDVDTTIARWTWELGDTIIQDTAPYLLHSFVNEGTYMVKVTIEDTLGCTSSETHPLIISLPVVGFDFDSIICEKTLVTYLNTSYGKDLTYFWNFGNGSTTDVQHPNPTLYTSPGENSVFLAIEDAYGCKDTAYATLYVKPQPKVNFTSDTAVSPCLPLVVTFTDNSTGATLARWQWDFGDGAITGDMETNIAYHTYTAPGNYDVKLSVWSDFDCQGQTSKSGFIKVSGPYAEFNVSPDSACVDDPLEFSITKNEGVASYMWVYGDGYDTTVAGNVTKVYHAFDYVGLRTPIAVYHDSSGVCNIPFIDTVYIHEVKAEFSFFPDSVGCGRLNTKVTSEALGADILRWNLGNGKQSQTQTNNLYYPSEGEYPVLLYVENKSIGCKDSITKFFVVKPMPEVTAFGDTLICRGDSTEVRATSSVSPVVWQWENRTLATTPSLALTFVKPEETQYFVANATDTNGCTGADSVRITVQDTPTVELFGDTHVIIGELVVLDPVSDSEVEYEWTPPGMLSCGDCPYPTYLAAQTDSFLLTVRDIYGCFERQHRFTIYVDERYSLDVPQAFTPNGDGVNDVIYVRGWGIKELLEFRIYNRWGEEVFSTNSVHTGWDGTYRGKAQGMDTYAYVVKVLRYSGEEAAKEGFIQLVR